LRVVEKVKNECAGSKKKVKGSLGKSENNCRQRITGEKGGNLRIQLGIKKKNEDWSQETRATRNCLRQMVGRETTTLLHGGPLTQDFGEK